MTVATITTANVKQAVPRTRRIALSRTTDVDRGIWSAPEDDFRTFCWYPNAEESNV
jgi:hypothetical protein